MARMKLNLLYHIINIMLISIDVGIKNLSICKINEHSEIHEWDVIDLSQDKPSIICEYVGNKGHCRHNATYTVSGKHFFCNRHIKNNPHTNTIAPETYYKMLHKKVSPKIIKELNTLYSLKENTQEQLLNHIYNVNATKLSPKRHAKDINLIDIGRTLSIKLTENIPDFSIIKTVLIENQISPIATRMKCIQGMLTQYFIEKGVVDIHFISSSNKLKHYQVPQKTYTERKKSCIAVTEELLSKDTINGKWLTLFKTHKKKDDLADSYLQGLWFLTYHTKQIA